MAMINFWAVLIDETGMEFGAGVTAPDRATAYEMLREAYPEARRIDQLESPEDTRRREYDIYARVSDPDYDYEEDL